MQLLNEEIEEMRGDGELLIAMDGNAKIGLLGERVSRNGELLLQTLANTELHVINGTDKCKGRITRKNTNNEEEISAIDFIIANENVRQWIQTMEIDEMVYTK